MDTRESISPDLAVEGFDTRYVDEHMFELVLKKGSSLNEVFAAINQQGLVISSMRNKANRLEELFVGLLNAK